MSEFFNATQMRKLESIGAVPHFYTAVNLSYKNNTSAKLDTDVADIYEKATGKSVSRNWACGKCSYELYRKAGEVYYASKQKAEDEAKDKPKKKNVGEKEKDNGKQ